MLTVERDVPLAPFSTFRIGGPADFFASVTTVAELIEALEYAADNSLKTFVFSGGSNLLFADHGFRGLVIRIANASARVSGHDIIADAGAPLLSIVRLAISHGLAGLERLAGIPGSLGGAIRGNAGAFGAEIRDSVLSVKVYDRQAKMLREFSMKQCDFGYRQSYFKTHPEIVILSATLRLEEWNAAELGRIAEETISVREAKHPQSARCAGSFFMNPIVTDDTLREEFTHDTGKIPKDNKLPAGWLIDHVGLRGKHIGGAQVSALHPNYIVNTGDATAEQVIMLASLVKQRVRDELDVQLREEVQLVGF
ncbi:MAG: UDP-N-acetylmuramate dehydrogenase [Candidatus Moraniibacteriota bacterium]